ncbi:VOC family protein [Bacillus amyloliquefaciens]|uniref:VOC family protein n=1 Tax=Bacillus amyloliquefaciens TaxID=1390 RepID=UPI002D810EC9|nr:VOC family protein [Bacillus amyloliquefaciens]MEB4596485.1 VOC family protein [Bacillus amyloliquefaciens]
MNPRITAITSGADNLEKSLHFYRDGLGLPTEGIACTEFEHGAAAYLQTGLKLALWDRKDIAHESNVTLTDPAHDAFWGGYAGHFQDPDGHLWEIVWNPHWDISE